MRLWHCLPNTKKTECKGGLKQIYTEGILFYVEGKLAALTPVHASTGSTWEEKKKQQQWKKKPKQNKHILRISDSWRRPTCGKEIFKYPEGISLNTLN